MIDEDLVEIVDAAFEKGYIAAWYLLFGEGVVAHAADLSFFAGLTAREALVAAVFAEATSVAGGDTAEWRGWGFSGGLVVWFGVWGWVLV